MKKEKPGVSGKNQKGEIWFNRNKFLEQIDSIEKVEEAEKGFAQRIEKNLVGRSDLTNQGYANSPKLAEKEIFEALKRSPGVDVSDVRIYVEGQTVTMAGSAENAKEARALGKIVQNIPGVSQVIDHLYVRKGSKLQ